MLDFLIVTGSLYLLYNFGMRQMVRACLFHSRTSDRMANFLFLTAGCTVTLYISVLFLFPHLAGWSVLAKSLLPTVSGIWLGEFMYSRNLHVTMRLLQRIRRKGDRTSE
ncbi:hypothetical protein [Effusibacillus dendaii]|uniref:Uncharacterized protein n=1 Tax=Effusibacillus dendaii TaxID=2743772 RepID=A0A7I8D7M7_9BACL|nr:hypothetical protein [Effusibacillus dendaii]BCJ85392.1 hypothetical protein skT53_03770 [Effusibacillus dendaii]